MNKNQKIYKIGYILRLLGLVGILYVLILSVPGGAWGVMLAFGLWYVTFPSMLALTIGHYLASNYKNR